MAQRISDIPRTVLIRNVTDEEYNLRGITSIRPHARMELNLFKHPEKLRAALWQSVKNGVFGRILVVESNVPITAEPVETALEELHSHYPGQTTVDSTGRLPDNPAPPPQPRDVFTLVAGISELLQQRLYALGIYTYLAFLSTDEQILAKIDGITEENLSPIIEAMVALMPPPEAPKVDRVIDPKVTVGITPASDNAFIPDGDDPSFSKEMALGN